MAVLCCYIEADHNIIMSAIIVSLCVVNYVVARTYKNKWDSPNVLFKRLITLETLAVVIATLQLVIAYPQLKIAYETATSDDVNKFQEYLQQFNSHVESFVLVDIPDSLGNEEVIKARNFPKRSMRILCLSLTPIEKGI